MKVIPLGTVSGKPTLNRNVSALAMVRDPEWLLFDCGEGTQIQAMRAGLSPSRLSAIFISHLHGDHFNGLAGYLSTMGLDRREKELVLVGPPGIRDYLDTLARLRILYVNYPLDIHEIGPRDFEAGSDGGPQPIVTSAGEGKGYSVSCLPLDHRVFALGYRLEEEPRPGRFDLAQARKLGIPEGPLYGRLQAGHSVGLPDGRTIHPSEVVGPARPGKAVAYCTDTRPCETVIELGRGVDLMIHEATFTSDLTDQAREYGHSTAKQAAEAALAAGARRLLITHFSPRYTDSTPLYKEATEVFPDTLLAEELVETVV
jgi:ribonuclease Z